MWYNPSCVKEVLRGRKTPLFLSKYF
jgi:hypothetical protein